MKLFHINKLWGPINAKPDPSASPQSHYGVTEIQLVTPYREKLELQKMYSIGFVFLYKKERSHIKS